MQFRTQATVYTQELLIHNGGQGQRAERLHTCVADFFRVFVFAFEFEGEIVCQMPALMVSAEEPQSVGIPDLERPEVQYTLCRSATCL